MPACSLSQSLGAKVEGMGFVVELDFLNGRKKFEGTEVFSLLHYDKQVFSLDSNERPQLEWPHLRAAGENH